MLSRELSLPLVQQSRLTVAVHCRSIEYRTHADAVIHRLGTRTAADAAGADAAADADDAAAAADVKVYPHFRFTTLCALL